MFDPYGSRPGEDVGLGRGASVPSTPAPPPSRVPYTSNYAAHLGRLIVSGGLPTNYEEPLFQQHGSVRLPSIIGPEAQARLRALKATAGLEPPQAPGMTGPLPNRLGVTLPWSGVAPAEGDNPVDSTFQGLFGPGSLGGTIMGSPTDQSGGGAMDVFGFPLATTPVNLTNFSAYGREAVPALLDSLFGANGGNNYQTPAGAGFGDENQGPTTNRTLLDDLIKGIGDVFRPVNDALMAFTTWARQADAGNRAKGVRDMVLSGTASTDLLDFAVNTLALNWDKYHLADIQQQAAASGVYTEDMVADLYDLSPEVVRQIFLNPQMSDQQMAQLVADVPFSYNPALNMMNEFGYSMAPFVIASAATGGAAGLPLLGRLGLGGARLVTGAEEAGGFARGLYSGFQGVRSASGLGQAAQVGGALTRGALQLNSWNTTVGWSIRSFEWGVKQVALVGGNKDLVDAMDKMLWNMPLSMNPGINIVTSFSSHPLQALGIRTRAHFIPTGRAAAEAGGLLRGSILVGTPGTLGEAGRIGRLGDGTFGLRVGRTHIVSEAPILGHLQTQLDSGDPLTAWMPFFDKLQIPREVLEKAYGPGNVGNLTYADLAEEILHVAMTAHRDQMGTLGAIGALGQTDIEAVSRAFVDQNLNDAHILFQKELEGRGTAISDAIKGQYWEYAKLNDTRQALIKAKLAEEWDPVQGFQGFLSSSKANKTLRWAFDNQLVDATAVATYRESVNLDFVRDYQANLAKLYPDPNEVVAVRDIQPLKTFGGMVEKRRGGSALVKGRKPPVLTRGELDKIIDSIVQDEMTVREGFDQPPRNEAARFRPGVDPEAASADPQEVQRALGIRYVKTMDTIHLAEAASPEELAGIAVPLDLARAAADDLHMSVEAITADAAASWPKLLEWFQGKVDEAVSTSLLRNTLSKVGAILDERRAGGGSDKRLMDAAKQNTQRAIDYVLNPIEREWLSKNDSMARRIRAALTALDEAAGDLEKVATSKFRTVRTEGGYAIPTILPSPYLTDLLGLIEKIVGSDRINPGDAEMLARPEVHPFFKLDLLRKANLTADERAIVDRIDFTVDEAAQNYIEQLQGIVADTLGPDTEFTPESVAQVFAGREKFNADVDSVAGQLEAVGGSLALVDGQGHSPELLDTFQRLDARQAQTGVPWRQEPMSTVTGPPDEVRIEARRIELEQRAADAQVAAAERRVAQSERDLAEAMQSNTVSDFTDPTWSVIVRKGGKVKAASIGRERGAITGRPWTIEKVKGGWEVKEGRLVPRTGEQGVARGGTPESGGAVLPDGRLEGPQAGEWWKGEVGGKQVEVIPAETMNVPDAPPGSVIIQDEAGATLYPSLDDARAALGFERQQAATAPETALEAPIAPEVAPDVVFPWERKPKTPTDPRMQKLEAEAARLDEVIDRLNDKENPTAKDEADLAAAEERGAAIEDEMMALADEVAPAAAEPVAAAPEPFPGLDEIEAYIKRTKTPAKKQYAQEWLDYRRQMWESAEELGDEPTRPAGLSYMAAQGVEMQIRDFMEAAARERTRAAIAGVERQVADTMNAAAAESRAEVLAPEQDAAAAALDERLAVDDTAGVVSSDDALLVSGGSASGSNVPVARPNEPAFTIKANPGEPIRAVVGNRIFRVTRRALARLQGIPDDYILPENESLARTIIGNGVPPPLMKAVVEPLLPLMGKDPHGVTLFSGGGIAEIGLKDDIKFMGAVEYNPEIAAVHQLNHPQSRMQNVDVREAQFSQYQGIDYLHASPVCKNFSAAKATRGEVELDIETARATARAIDEMGPQVVTVENVPRYQGSEALKIITDKLTERGYTWDINVFDAADYGVPQHRLRMLLRATLKGDLPALPAKQPHVGWYDAIKDLDLPDDPKGLAPWQVKRLEKQGFKFDTVEQPIYGTTTDFPIPGRETTRVAARYRLMEIDDLKTSNEPGYPKQLQPRNRTSVTSDAQIAEIANTFDPPLAFRTESGSHGPAVVDASGNVLAANGRTMAMRQMSKAKWAAYHELLTKRAAEFGLSKEQIEGMDRPVLVREIDAADATSQLATDLNVEAGRMTTVEQARVMADAIPPESLDALKLGEKTTLPTALVAQHNKGFVEGVLALMNPQERAKMFDEHGTLNDDGVTLISKAILQKVLRDPTGELISKIINGSEFLNVRNGIEDASGQLAKAQAAFDQGRLSESIADTLRNAMASYEEFVRGQLATGERPVTMYDTLDPLASDLGWVLSRMKSKPEVTAFFREYAKAQLDRAVDQAGEGAGMFGMEATPQPGSMLKSMQDAINVLNAKRREGVSQAKLEFDEAGNAIPVAPRVVEELPQFPDPDGSIPQRFETSGGVESMARDVPVVESPEAAIVARMGPSQRQAIGDSPLDPTAYSTLGEGTEGVMWVQSEAGRVAVQSLYDNPEMALSIYRANIQRAIQGGLQVGDAGRAFLLRQFDEAAERINTGTGTGGDILLVDRLSRNGFRLDVNGEFIGRPILGKLTEIGENDYAALGESLRGKRLTAATEFPHDIDAAVLNSPAKDTRAFEAGSGVEPDLTPEEVATHTAIDSGAQTFVKRGGAHDAAARKITGQSTGNPANMVNEINPPDEAKMLRLAQAEHEAAQAELLAAQSAKAAVPPKPDTTRPPELVPLDPDIRDLLYRYVAANETPQAAEWNAWAATPGENMGQVVDVLNSLDQGVPPLAGAKAMAPEELATLRAGLYDWLNARLDTLPGVPPKRTARAAQAIEQARVKRGQLRLDNPEGYQDEVVKVWREMEHIVKDDDGWTTGWEGTQYDIGTLPMFDAQGKPLPPRVLSTESLLDALNRVSPDLSSEVLMGRKQSWEYRVPTARLATFMRQIAPDAITSPSGKFRRGVDLLLHQAASNPEKDLRAGTVGRWLNALVGERPASFDDAAMELWQKDREQAAGLINALHKWMTEPSQLAGGGFRKYRNEYLMPPKQFEKEIADKLTDGGRVDKPEWARNFEARSKSETPYWDAWATAENRIRNWFAGQDNGVAKYVESLYARQGARKLSARQASLAQHYHYYRFLLDVRWRGLEVIDAPTLTLFREGWQTVADAWGIEFKGGRPRKTGKMPKPMFAGKGMGLDSIREDFAWWMGADYVGGTGLTLRNRENYILALVKKTQVHDFPDVMLAMARDDPAMAQALKAMGDSPADWLERLSNSWELYSSLSRKISPEEAQAIYGPRLADGTINQAKFDELMEAAKSESGYHYVKVPAFEAEIAAAAGNPVLLPMMERIKFLNEQAWNDAAQTIFGQTDRSNIQRLLNHPLLYWPISYQIKATKWLFGLLFDRAFGMDLGSFPAMTLDVIHQKHMEQMRDDPEYRKFFADNETLLFLAGMLFPITPFDINVGLSPFTRLAVDLATGAGDYQRNLFSFGPGYTFFNLLPRVIRQTAKNAPPGIVKDLFTRAESLFPQTFQLDPTTSQQGQAAQQAAPPEQLPLQPFQPPNTRVGPP